jgi:DNA-binding transcriptional ArsR family regulator
MKDGPNISGIAALLGDPARGNMLAALMNGQALTASELAHEAGVAASTASGHLSKLESAGLVVTRRQGRHRYFHLSGHDVAHVLEALDGLAARVGHTRALPGPKDEALRQARVCYDHLAGTRGVHLLESLRARKFIQGSDEELDVTEAGERTLARFGIDFEALKVTRRPLCRACLDWSERRSHLSGALGAAILQKLYAKGWARREKASRVVTFSRHGAQAFERTFGTPS